MLDILEKCPESQRKGEFPVVVFEGLDATGRSVVWVKSSSSCWEE